MKKDKQKRFSQKSFNNNRSGFKNNQDSEQYSSNDSFDRSNRSFNKAKSSKFGKSNRFGDSSGDRFNKGFKNSQKFIDEDQSSSGYRSKNKTFSKSKNFRNSNEHRNNFESDTKFENPNKYRQSHEGFRENYRDFRDSSANKFPKKPSRFRDYDARSVNHSLDDANKSSSKKWHDFRQQKKNIVFENDQATYGNNSNQQKSLEKKSPKKNNDPSRLSYFIQPFHLAMPVNNLDEARKFYGEFLGFSEGRSNEHWIDWNFFGHQFVTHLRQHAVDSTTQQIINEVDDHGVPVPHFGVVLSWNQWHDFAEKLKQAEIKFVIEPYIRFKDQVGEQATMFFCDPSGNAMEFKAFKDISQLFKKYPKAN